MTCGLPFRGRRALCCGMGLILWFCQRVSPVIAQAQGQPLSTLHHFPLAMFCYVQALFICAKRGKQSIFLEPNSEENVEKAVAIIASVSVLTERKQLLADQPFWVSPGVILASSLAARSCSLLTPFAHRWPLLCRSW